MSEVSETFSFPHPLVWLEIQAADPGGAGLGLEGASSEDAPDRCFATGSVEERKRRIGVAWQRWAARGLEPKPHPNQIWARRKTRTSGFLEHARIAPRLRKDADGTTTCLDVLLTEEPPSRTVDRDYVGRFGLAPGKSTGGTESHLPIHRPPQHRFLSISIPGECFYCGIQSRRRWFLSDNKTGRAKDAERAMCSNCLGKGQAERAATRRLAIQLEYLLADATVKELAERWNLSGNTIRQRLLPQLMRAKKAQKVLLAHRLMHENGHSEPRAAQQAGVSPSTLQRARRNGGIQFPVFPIEMPGPVRPEDLLDGPLAELWAWAVAEGVLLNIGWST